MITGRLLVGPIVMRFRLQALRIECVRACAFTAFYAPFRDICRSAALVALLYFWSVPKMQPEHVGTFLRQIVKK